MWLKYQEVLRRGLDPIGGVLAGAAHERTHGATVEWVFRLRRRGAGIALPLPDRLVHDGLDASVQNKLLSANQPLHVLQARCLDGEQATVPVVPQPELKPERLWVPERAAVRPWWWLEREEVEQRLPHHQAQPPETSSF